MSLKFTLMPSVLILSDFAHPCLLKNRLRREFDRYVLNKCFLFTLHMDSYFTQEVLACTVVIFVGALLSTFAPNYFWIMVFSTVVGLGMGGVAQW